jgi:hypothetical protein
MSTHLHQTQKDKEAVQESPYAQREPMVQFVDNRPQHQIHQSLKNAAQNSPQTQQTIQLREMMDQHSESKNTVVPTQPNKTGLPDQLKTGVENLSGYSMDDVKVHRNSPKPAQLQAHAYAQGTDIHLAPGQGKHLPHEAWHVVQQKQGRVKPTMQMKGKVNVNDDAGLEREADVMGGKATSNANHSKTKAVTTKERQPASVVQRIKVGSEGRPGLIRGQITTVKELATILSEKEQMDSNELIAKINKADKTFPDLDETLINKFLEKNSNLRIQESITQVDKFIISLVNVIKQQYTSLLSDIHPDFHQKLETVERTNDYTTLMDPEGINYSKGTDSTASIGQKYNKTMACSLFALLRLKPGFLGAKDEEHLHYIFRTNLQTREYDEDVFVAKIRLAAGLKPHNDKEDVKGLQIKGNKKKKIIIDPVGDAHTFVLEHTAKGWKKYDNDNQEGTPNGNQKIRVYWTL